jgi:hypothetical protein
VIDPFIVFWVGAPFGQFGNANDGNDSVIEDVWNVILQGENYIDLSK